MKTVSVPSDQVRVPAQQAGTATVIRRYDAERAIVLHPDDFHRLMALDELAATTGTLPEVALSAAAVEAHLDESTPGESITDPAALLAVLGD